MDEALRIARWRALLDINSGVVIDPPRRTPVGQLVKSLISSRTRDEVSLAAYAALGERFGSAVAIAAASPSAIEEVIATVQFPDVKAERLVTALRAIKVELGGFQLEFLGGWPLPDALGWLERLPGVGRKTSASVMNFSTIARPVMVVDTHITRVLTRLGLGRPDATALSEQVTAAMPGWSADDFLTFHVQLKRLGQTVCRWDLPQCEACPLAGECDTAQGTKRRQGELFG